jgi:hypothetical protein
MKTMKFKLVHSHNQYSHPLGTDFGFVKLKNGDYTILETSLADRVIEAGGADYYTAYEDFDADTVATLEPAYVGATFDENRLQYIKQTFLETVTETPVENVEVPTEQPADEVPTEQPNVVSAVLDEEFAKEVPETDDSSVVATEVRRLTRGRPPKES